MALLNDRYTLLRNRLDNLDADKRDGTITQEFYAERQAAWDGYSEDFDVRMSVIQDLIPLGLKAVAEALQGEVKRLAGEKHRRGGDNARWGGAQNGSVDLRDQKFAVRVPRVAMSASTKKCH